MIGIERAYSIVSAPDEEYLELFLELVHPPEGVFTPIIWGASVGDKVTCRFKPKGIFLLNDKVSNHFLIATVTGIVPYVSMIRDYLHKGEDKDFKFFVAHGASYTDEFVYDSELRSYAEKYPEIIELIGGSPFGTGNLKFSIIFSIIFSGFPFIFFFFFELIEYALLLLNSHILSGSFPNIVYLPLIFPFSTDSNTKLFLSLIHI